MCGSYRSEVEMPVQQSSNSLHMVPAPTSPCFLSFLRRVFAYWAGLQEGDICLIFAAAGIQRVRVYTQN